MIYVTGDTHGNIIGNLWPKTNKLNKNDILIICGDCGIAWPHSDKNTMMSLNFLQNAIFKTIILFGNHDNYDFAETLPIVGNTSNGFMREMVFQNEVYDNIFIVDFPQIIKIDGNKCLFIPGADSHDIENLAYPFEKAKIYDFQKDNKLYRVVHESWWPQESINIKYAKSLIDNSDKDFDYVFTHDCPANLNKIFKPFGEIARFKPTEGQLFLQDIADNCNYKHWFHGHMHSRLDYNNNKNHLVYHEIPNVDTLEEI